MPCWNFFTHYVPEFSQRPVFLESLAEPLRIDIADTVPFEAANKGGTKVSAARLLTLWARAGSGVPRAVKNILVVTTSFWLILGAGRARAGCVRTAAVPKHSVAP